MTQRPKELLDQARDAIPLKHCAYSRLHTFRHSCATHLLENHHDIPTAASNFFDLP